MNLKTTLIDPHGRHINYLRLSITDLCNLRCFYCGPFDRVPKLEHFEILSHEEILEFVNVASSMGIYKIRITGGEPLVKRGLINLVKKIKKTNGVKILGMTTNAVKLADMASRLKKAGLDSVNISLDSLKPDVFKEITGHDKYEKVLAGIYEAQNVGLTVKINTVLLKEINCGELSDFVFFAKKNNVEVRFIEQMTFDMNTKIFSRADAISILKKNHDVKEISPSNPSPHVNYLLVDNAKIGFISPVTHVFCDSCNKLRLTAQGQLRVCLATDFHIDIKSILRNHHSAVDIQRAIILAVQKKPATGPWDVSNEMSRVGG